MVINIMRVMTVFCLLMLSFMGNAWAQKVESRVYFCVDAAGNLLLSNVGPKSGCTVRTIITPAVVRRVPPLKVVHTEDPLFNKNISSVSYVPMATQQQRDETRGYILQAELARERAALQTLQSEYQNGAPERLGSEKNYQKYLKRVQMLKEKINMTQLNISALQRELARGA